MNRRSRVSFVAAVCLCTAPLGAAAADFPPELVQAFVVASIERTDQADRQTSVIVALGDGKTIESLVQTGKITTVYDCLPELRSTCFDAISQNAAAKETTIEEWGEWRDLTNEQRDAFIARQFGEAAKRGFNLLTDDELTAASGSAAEPSE